MAEVSVQEEFGSRLRLMRTRAGLSQEACSLAVGLDRSYLGQVERGERNISIVNVYKIAAGLNVNPCLLLPQVTELGFD